MESEFSKSLSSLHEGAMKLRSIIEKINERSKMIGYGEG